MFADSFLFFNLNCTEKNREENQFDDRNETKRNCPSMRWMGWNRTFKNCSVFFITM